MGKTKGAVVGVNVVNQIVVLTLLMLLGVLLKKTKVVNDAMNKSMATILINCAMPGLILQSFNIKFTMAMWNQAVEILIISAVIHIFFIVFTRIVYRRFPASKRAVLYFATVFSNCGFVGYPVIYGLFGNIGIFYTSIFGIPFNVLMWSYGIVIFTGKTDMRFLLKSVFNLPMLATLLGLVLFLCSIPLPTALSLTFSSVGGLTTPLSMFIIGAMLADVKLSELLKGVDVYLASFLKLIVFPIGVGVVLKALHVEQTLVYVSVILVAMPTASLVGVFAEKYDGDRGLASRCAFITTVLSLITIPGITFLL